MRYICQVLEHGSTLKTTLHSVSVYVVVVTETRLQRKLMKSLITGSLLIFFREYFGADTRFS
jgi:hypothetical protein